MTILDGSSGFTLLSGGGGGGAAGAGGAGGGGGGGGGGAGLGGGVGGFGGGGGPALGTSLLVNIGNVSVTHRALSMNVVSPKLARMLLKDVIIYVDGHRSVVSKAIHGNRGETVTLSKPFTGADSENSVLWLADGGGDLAFKAPAYRGAAGKQVSHCPTSALLV